MSTVNGILSQLNPPQQEAVVHDRGPLLILAGAGSGKTRALTFRVAYLVKEKKVSPSQILLVTFTNRAANEMRQRLQKLLGGETSLPFAGTFHSFCARLLRREGKYIGLPANFAIYDDHDQQETVKQAMIQVDIPVKKFNPSSVLATISQAKNELISSLEYNQYAKGYFQETVARIFPVYQKLLREYQALDFDDLLLEAVRLFQKEKQVLSRYQDKFHYLLVDEYQDTNRAQYQLTKLLSGRWRNLCVVGDCSQCLPRGTMIETPKGSKKIERIKEDDQIIAATGRGKTSVFSVNKVYQRLYKGELIYLETKDGKNLRLTPNHILFAALHPSEKIYWVYLMYRRDKGYRIGMAKGKRYPSRNRSKKSSIGLIARGYQENADKMWIIKTCYHKQEATFWEMYYAAKYGLPTLVFGTGGRKMQITEKQINQFYFSIKTAPRAQKLMKDFELDHNFPHYRPQGISGNKQSDRQVIHLKFFEDPRQSIRSPWSAHRIALNTTDRNLEKQVKKAHFHTREGRRNTWRTEILRHNYKEANQIVQKLSKTAGNIDISYEAFLGEKGKFFFHRASHIQPEMVIAIKVGKTIKEKIVSKVTRQKYNGLVYDLDVKQVHNYLANGIVVHNSIYSWRGADYRNVLNLKGDFPDLKTINLEQNYRSTQTILEAANQVITKNTSHPVLNLWTKNKKGEKIIVFEASSELEEALFVAHTIQNLNTSSQYQLGDFAVLYRTNAQSRVLEEVLLRIGLPYRLIGGVRFYERKEIKDCLAYLRLLANPADLVSYQRAQKLGKRRLDRFYDLAEKIKGKKLSTLKILDQILKKTGYRKTYEKKEEEDAMRLENIKELRSVATQFPDLSEFLESVALIQRESLPKNKSRAYSDEKAITLMTAHAAKGTEFKVVFLVGMEEGLFPHSRSIMEKEELEEERRLCYVGLTRAKERLYLTFARRRLYFGQRITNPPSRFIEDINQNLIESAETALSSDI